MRIIQITAAHVSQGEEPQLHGLGDDGIVYVYRYELKPYTVREQVIVAADQILLTDHICYPVAQEATPFMTEKQAAQELQTHQRYCEQNVFLPGQINPAPVPAPAPWNESLRGQATQVQAQPRMQTRPLQYVVSREVFKDGWTEGWQPLSMAFSKPVPHKEDPTRCERC